jgi:hypothetical protein
MQRSKIGLIDQSSLSLKMRPGIKKPIIKGYTYRSVFKNRPDLWGQSEKLQQAQKKLFFLGGYDSGTR